MSDLFTGPWHQLLHRPAQAVEAHGPKTFLDVVFNGILSDAERRATRTLTETPKRKMEMNTKACCCFP